MGNALREFRTFLIIFHDSCGIDVGGHGGKQRNVGLGQHPFDFGPVPDRDFINRAILDQIH
jgi:hypothetical protein